LSKKRSATTAKVVLTSRAISDLTEIFDFSIEQWGKATADRYLDDLEAAIDRLASQPDLLRLEPGISSHLYFYRVRKHYLVCDFRDKSICILTVIHTSMDIPGKLVELEPRLQAEVDYLHGKLAQRPTK
jgi:toxin ParE1/3/4